MLPHPARSLCLVVILSACGAAKIEAPKGATGSTPAPARPSGDAAIVLPADGGPGDAAAVPPPSPPMACAAASWKAESVPVDLVFVIDQSPSMAYKIGERSKWSLAQDALRSFLADPRSAGLGVGLQFFPTHATGVPCADDNDCGLPFACTNAICRYPLSTFPSCAPGDYQRLAVDVSPLPAARERLVAALDRPASATWVTSPLGPAAQGVLKALRARMGAPPGRRAAAVFVTDGVPSGCLFGWTDVEDIVAGLQAEQRPSAPLPVYVIGLYSDSPQEDTGGPAALARYAAAGGTGTPFTVKPPGDVTRAFLDALDQIRAASVPCEYVIPAAQPGIDFAKVNLRAKLPSGEVEIPYVARAERCDPTRGGWYYDTDPAAGTPTRVLACPATCQGFKTAVQAEVSLTFGCKTVTIE